MLLASELELDDSPISPKNGYVLIPVRNSTSKVVKIDQDVSLGNVCQVVEKEGDLINNI